MSWSQNKGFVLVSTLWILVAMTLFVSYFSIVVSDSQDQAFEIKSQMQAKLDRRSTLSTLLYFMSTRPVSYAGLRMEKPEVRTSAEIFSGPNPYLPSGNEIKLDGRWYNGRGSSLFSIQDEGSLISLRSDNFDRLTKLLASLDLDSREQIKLIASLRDYTDRDRSRSLDGAEDAQYRGEGLILPTNRFLISPRQIHNVLNWNKYLNEVQLDKLMDQLSIYIGSNENYNSMTSEGMKSINVEQREIDEILDYRRNDTFVSVSEVNQLTGSLIRDDPFTQSFFPSNYLRISIGQLGQEQVEWVGVTLTPKSNLAPWQIDYNLYRKNTFLGSMQNNATNTIENTKTPLFN
ncbi:MAG: hypothetical protein ACJA2O_004296 [Candidatus Azotimanducaceae bacterium]